MARIKGIQNQVPMDFMLPETDWVRPASLPDLTNRGNITIDVETKDEGLAIEAGPAWFRRGGFITGVTIGVHGKSVYAPVRLPETDCFDRTAVIDWVRHHIRWSRDHGRRVRVHNGPYDMGWLWGDFGIEPDYEVDDTMAMAFCLDENRLRYSLDATAEWQGIAGKDETMLRAAADAFGVDPKSGMWKIPARYQARYAEQDVAATTELAEKMIPQLEANGLMDAYQLEADILPLTVRMRMRGVRINSSRAEQNMEYCYSESRKALDELSERYYTGKKWVIENVRSNHFMADMFTREGVPFPKTTKGNDSFSNEWMSKSDHPLPQLCARALKYHDAAEKFIGSHILGSTHMGRIHAEVHSMKDDRGGTRTTRFSYSNPPLQQMPSRDDDIAPRIRQCFMPEEGDVWAAVDYSQQEFRLMVHFASVCKMEGADRPVAMYNENPDTDFHDMVVEITGLPRRRAKDVNFAKAFGAGPPKFALMTGMTLDEAKVAMREYDDRLPFVSRLAEFCQKRADFKGYIRMIDGFRGRFERWEPRWLDYEKVKQQLSALRAAGLPLPDLAACDMETAQRRRDDPNHPWYGQRLRRAFTHKAMNTLIQGSAARQMKMAMRQCYREGIIPLLQMHDELDLSVGTPEEAHRVGEIMSSVVKLVIPVKTDVEFGVNWGRAAKDKATGHVPTWEAAVRDRDSGEWT